MNVVTVILGPMRRRRHGFALFVLGVAVFPWLSAAITALHSNGHAGHHGTHVHPADAMNVAVHGHDHAPGTAEHEHILTLPGGVLTNRLPLGPVPSAFDAPAVAGPAMPRWSVVGGGGVGHDPPSYCGSPPILRI